jgi:exosortase/archaeosortase family protein
MDVETPETSAKQERVAAEEQGGTRLGGDRLLAGALVVVTAAVFWPVTRWLVAEATARDQIRQAAMLLGAAAALVAWQHRDELRLKGDLCDRTLILMTAAFAAVAAAGLAAQPWLVLPGFALALAGCLQAWFGAEAYRYFRPLVAGVAALFVIIIAFPVLDWPLRQLAGVGAGVVLDKAGLAPNLTLMGTAADPQLLLSVAGGNFLVATECNGFGLITSGALVAILAGGIAGRPWWKIAALVPLGVAIGFLFNLLRILVISTTAQYFPGRYDALHEIVGTLALWAGLGLVGWLAWRPAVAAAAARPAGATA